MDSYDPPESIGTKKVQTYLVWRHSDVISEVMSKTRKSPKIAKIMVFRYFFKQKLHFLAMMCVKVCLHMFLLQINQINKIKHSETVFWKQKHDLCVIPIENQFLVSFSLDPALYYATPRHNPRSDFFFKMVVNWAQGLKKKSHEVSARKNTRNQFDMYSFVSLSWCAFWQKNDMLLKWSILKKHIRAKTTKENISSQGHSAFMWFLNHLCT